MVSNQGSIEVDVAVSLIQLIALFLPAWAVMIQIVTRIMSQDRIDERPLAIPFIAGVFASAIFALFEFAFASVMLIDFFRVSGYLGNSASLTAATEHIAFGGLAFLFLGLFVIAEAGATELEDDDFVHVFIITVAFVCGLSLAWAGKFEPWLEGPGGVGLVAAIIWAVDAVYIQLYDDRVQDSKLSNILSTILVLFILLLPSAL